MKQRRRRFLLAKHIQTSLVGGRCNGFEPSCIVCAFYHFYDLYKRYPKNWEQAVVHQKELERLAELGALKGTPT